MGGGLTPGCHGLGGSLNEGGAHNEVPTGVDHHSLPCPLVQPPEPASPCNHILHTTQTVYHAHDPISAPPIMQYLSCQVDEALYLVVVGYASYTDIGNPKLCLVSHKLLLLVTVVLEIGQMFG